jgi:hypothetical protein
VPLPVCAEAAAAELVPGPGELLGAEVVGDVDGAGLVEDGEGEVDVGVGDVVGAGLVEDGAGEGEEDVGVGDVVGVGVGVGVGGTVGAGVGFGVGVGRVAGGHPPLLYPPG